ncbi:hypothetical protein [Acidovorax phage ACPWH]|nr:hypothetical protein [Acidovorax phage ACPWH]
MATLDIFQDDAFSVTSLSQTITDIPDIPTRLGDKGLFSEEGISTLSFMIERQGASIKLLPTAPRGGVREPVALGPRKLIPLQALHIPATWSVQADEVQGIRAFGSETEVEQARTLVQRKLNVVRQAMDLTHENMRVGALKGQVLDADGSLLLDVYQAFGMTQQTQFWNIASPANGDPKASIIVLKDMIRKKMGGRSMGKIRVICSLQFFTNLVQNNKMLKAWELWNQGAYLRTDQVNGGDFEFAGVVFEIYDGGVPVGNTFVPFIPEGEAYAYPEGVPGMFQSKFAPADYMETVNTQGIPFYAKQEAMPFNKGIIGEAQSNPIHFNSLPEAVVRLKDSAS